MLKRRRTLKAGMPSIKPSTPNTRPNEASGEESKDAANRRYTDIEVARIVDGMNRLRGQRENQTNRRLARLEATLAVAGLNRLREQKNAPRAARQKPSAS